MILNYSVCDHCGNRAQIIKEEKESESFEFFFCSLTIKEAVQGHKPYPNKFQSSTFCNRNCLIEYLKNKLDMKGNFINEVK